MTSAADWLDRAKDLMSRKGQDYGTSQDSLANVRSVSSLGVSPFVGCEIRQLDKSSRIANYVRKGQLNNESVEDSLLDRIVYAAIQLQLLSEEPARSVGSETGAVSWLDEVPVFKSPVALGDQVVAMPVYDAPPGPPAPDQEEEFHLDGQEPARGWSK